MSDAEFSRLDWCKSSYSGGSNDCVEVALTSGGTAVRDSKNPAAGLLLASAGAWRGLLAAVRAGGLDLR
ncbi:DUF397 domain-containing protein [Amycolatopsis nigrescens]|uniref:DUF397 domain-containing protein n=1 Tax=Amycolatopsis nigrescens TaxID=381445 RepID=UPI000373F090|nr:DUF397 domain-containing protein [Amycolatopsis nigrescens]